VSARDHDLLIQAVYDAADDPAGLVPALVTIAEALRAFVGHAMAISSAGVATQNEFFGADPASFVEYEQHWRDLDPRMALATANLDKALSDVLVVDAKEFERSAIYNEHLVPADQRYTVFGVFRAGPDLVLANAFLRPKRRGAFEEEDTRRFASIAPHLARVVRLRETMSSLRDKVDDLSRALDVLPMPVAILDADATVVCANASAEDLFKARDGLRTENGRLTASIASENKALVAAIAKAVAVADASLIKSSRARLATATVSRAFGSMNVVFLPLRPRNVVREQGSRAARVLAMIHDPTRITRVDRALVAQLHGLTATEAELAASLAEGRSLAEFAAARGSSEQTARTHLKRILDKTQTKRQADLVRLILTGVATHGLR